MKRFNTMGRINLIKQGWKQKRKEENKLEWKVENKQHGLKIVKTRLLECSHTCKPKLEKSIVFKESSLNFLAISKNGNCIWMVEILLGKGMQIGELLLFWGLLVFVLVKVLWLIFSLDLKSFEPKCEFYIIRKSFVNVCRWIMR